MKSSAIIIKNISYTKNQVNSFISHLKKLNVKSFTIYLNEDDSSETLKTKDIKIVKTYCLGTIHNTRYYEEVYFDASIQNNKANIEICLIIKDKEDY